MENKLQNWEQMTYPFTSLSLNYQINALEPYIDSKTMILHYQKYLENYLIKLNQLLENQPDLQKLNLLALIQYAQQTNNSELTHLAGAVYNHCFYFSQLRPATGQIIIGISPEATQKVIANFGGWKNLKEQLATCCEKMIGVGYVWLIKNAIGKLEIVTTKNEAIPLNGMPIINIDMWEHAYLGKYENNCRAYVEAFWNVIDWVKFSNRI